MTGDQLRAVYLNAGMSRRAFARHIGVPEQSIRRYEDGEGMSPPNAKRLADYLGITVVELLSVGDGDDSSAKAAAA
jgi:ribosome-binding protein aMBF1 (putative translation factor)